VLMHASAADHKCMQLQSGKGRTGMLTFRQGVALLRAGTRGNLGEL
jgi:hypothetical protein